jgi:hypothetical protein
VWLTRIISPKAITGRKQGSDQCCGFGDQAVVPVKLTRRPYARARLVNLSCCAYARAREGGRRDQRDPLEPPGRRLDPNYSLAVPDQGRPHGQDAAPLGARPSIALRWWPCHPKQDIVAAGYGDGMVLLVRIADGAEILAKKPGEAPVTAPAWTADGALLAFGTESGEPASSISGEANASFLAALPQRRSLLSAVGLCD